MSGFGVEKDEGSDIRPNSPQVRTLDSQNPTFQDQHVIEVQRGVLTDNLSIIYPRQFSITLSATMARGVCSAFMDGCGKMRMSKMRLKVIFCISGVLVFALPSQPDDFPSYL